MITKNPNRQSPHTEETLKDPVAHVIPQPVKEERTITTEVAKTTANYSPEIAAVQADALRARSQWQELKEQAVLAFESGLLPRSVDTKERAITIAMMGKELGVAPMQSLCGIYVVNGMMALRGSLMLRLIYERVPGARISVLTPADRADLECEIEMLRPHAKPQVFRFTIEEARKAGFMNKPIWAQHTATMLRWAAIRTGARVVFADAIAGCYMEDEIPSSDTSHMPVESPAVAASVRERTPHEPIYSAPLETTSSDAAPQLHSRVVPQERMTVGMLPRRVTEKQVSRMYAIARSEGWNRQEIVRTMLVWFDKREAGDLNRTEYDQICDYMLKHGSKDFLQTGDSAAAN